MGPQYPSFQYKFLCKTIEIPFKNWAVLNQLNPHKTLIPLYTRETRPEKDFTTKKNEQQIEKTCSKNRLIRRL